MGSYTGKWVHPTWAQSITTLFSVKSDVSLGEYYTAESSHHNTYTNGVNETQITALGAQEPQTTCSSSAAQSQVSGTVQPRSKHKLCGYSTPSNNSPTTYLLALVKTTIYKTYLATKSTHRHIPDYQRMFRVRLQYRLYTEMHCSL
jgi:hypothetical protein